MAARPGSFPAAEVRLTAPLDYQVIQRTTRTEGTVLITVALADRDAVKTSWQARITSGGQSNQWRDLRVNVIPTGVSASLTALAGGWRRLEVRGLDDGRVVAESAVEHIGIGEVFVVAGQSNSANHGEERQQTQTRRVAAFDGQKWRLAEDPQPGASGQGGSFVPPLGDELVHRLDVPVAFISCGIGATSVREWLPKGSIFPSPPTIEERVEKLPNGFWSSKGAAYDNFIARLKSVGPNGFRAVLWHQGESDANQKDPTRSLPGALYREYLETLIRTSRREIGWDVPWFVAQVSYHTPGDEVSPDIRAAQASLWRDHLACQGPDSDALKGLLRESNGQGVHFSGPGLRHLAAMWAEKIGSWLQQQMDGGPSRPPAAQRSTGTSP
jgi:hypothetical protein